MWINVPSAARRLKSGHLAPFDFGNYKYCPCIVLDSYPVEIQDYFYDTQHRKINDCIHVKPTVGGITRKYCDCVSAGWRYSPTGQVSNSTMFKQWWQEIVTYDGRPGHVLCMLYASALESKRELDGIHLTRCNLNFYAVGLSEKTPTNARILQAPSNSGAAFRKNIHPYYITINGVRVKEVDSAVFWKRAYPNLSDAIADIVGTMANEFRSYYNCQVNPGSSVNPNRNYPYCELGVPIYPQPSRAMLKLDENLQFEGYDDITYRSQNGYWKRWMIQHSYIMALQSTPEMNDNNIANIISLVSFLKSLLVDHRVEIPRNWQSAWLAYRYSYKTTKSDVEDAISFAKRMSNLQDASKSLKCYGISSHTVGETDITCRCTLTLTPKHLNALDKVLSALNRYGLSPTAYRLWDLIPYSFVVDWFVPVGDMLDVAETKSRIDKEFSIHDVCFSIQYNVPWSDGYDYHIYYRWASQPLSSLNEFYWLDKPSTSDKVKMMRIADASSLFIK